VRFHQGNELIVDGNFTYAVSEHVRTIGHKLLGVG